MKFDRLVTILALTICPILVGVLVVLLPDTGAVGQSFAQRGQTVSNSASPSASPSDHPLRPGQLSESPNLVAFGRGVLAAQTATDLLVTTDQGLHWTAHHLPGSSIRAVVDPANPLHIVTGGEAIMQTVDGATFGAPPTVPPKPAMYVPLLIPASDSKTWFFAHNGQLLRTRDSGTSWKDLVPSPPSAVGLMVAGGGADQYIVAGDDRVFGFDNHLTAFQDDGSLASGVKAIGLAFVGGRADTILVRGNNAKDYIHRSNAWVETGDSLAGPVAGNGLGLALIGDGARRAEPGHVNFSSDAGITWSAGKGLPLDQSVDALAVEPDGSRVFAYCYGGDIYISADGGASWSQWSSGLRTASQ